VEDGGDGGAVHAGEWLSGLQSGSGPGHARLETGQVGRERRLFSGQIRGVTRAHGQDQLGVRRLE